MMHDRNDARVKMHFTKQIKRSGPVLLLGLFAAVCASCERDKNSRSSGGEAPIATLDATGGPGSISFKVFADGYQVYVYDSRTEPIFIDWNNQTISDKLAVKQGAFAFCPMREMDVPVTLRVRTEPPADESAQWDHVTECPLDVPSGRVLVLGPVDSPSVRVDVKPGSYRVRISGGGFSTIDASGLNGSDHYELCLWPADAAPPQVKKRWKDPAPTTGPSGGP